MRILLGRIGSRKLWRSGWEYNLNSVLNETNNGTQETATVVKVLGPGGVAVGWGDEYVIRGKLTEKRIIFEIML